MARLSDFIETVGETLADSPVGAFQSSITELRTKLYRCNFFYPVEEETGIFKVERGILSPTPLAEQYNFFESYDNVTAMMNDLYSIIYKPVAIALMSTALLLNSGSCLLRGINNLFLCLMPAVVEDDILNSDKSEDSVFENIGESIVEVLAAAYLVTVWATVDTASSAISFVTRLLASLWNGLANGFEALTSEEDDMTVAP